MQCSEVVDLGVNWGRLVASIGAPSYSFRPKNAAPRSSTTLRMQSTYIICRLNLMSALLQVMPLLVSNTKKWVILQHPSQKTSSEVGKI